MIVSQVIVEYHFVSNFVVAASGPWNPFSTFKSGTSPNFKVSQASWYPFQFFPKSETNGMMMKLLNPTKPRPEPDKVWCFLKYRPILSRNKNVDTFLTQNNPRQTSSENGTCKGSFCVPQQFGHFEKNQNTQDLYHTSGSLGYNELRRDFSVVVAQNTPNPVFFGCNHDIKHCWNLTNDNLN